MKHIKDCLPHISVSNSHQNWKFQLMNEWTAIMGSLVGKVSIYKIYNNSIILGVSDSGWMQELYLLSNLIKQKINAVLDRPRIETIRFHYVTKQTCKKPDTIVTTEIIAKERSLTTREKKALDKITDPELSEVLIRLLQKCHQ